MSTITTAEAERLADELRAAFKLVELWPERRGEEGFMDLLALRNKAPAAEAALLSLAAERDALAESVDTLELHNGELVQACSDLDNERDALAAENARLRELLEDQVEQHRATWIAARAHVEGEEHSAYLFDCEPATVRARAALSGSAP